MVPRLHRAVAAALLSAAGLAACRGEAPGAPVDPVGRLVETLRADTVGGVPVVRRVLPDSPADQAGFKPGQVVLKVGDVSVKSPLDVYSIAEEQGILIGRKLQLTIADVEGETSTAPRTIDIQVLR